LVAAASDLTGAFEELGRQFQEDTGLVVTFSFGSSGLLAEQIRQGAPFDVFASADLGFVEEVVAAGRCDRATLTPYAQGRIVIWSRRGMVTPPPSSLQELADPRFQRIAIANPEHAPYGRAAQGALGSAGIWSAVAPRMVFGENIRQALQFAQTGNAEAAIVALALVILDEDNPWVLVDDELHEPIDQTLVVCTGGAQRGGGDAFARFVNSDAARAVMRRYGFTPPGGPALLGEP
jgi:molybdate transport system substrate-binding protein